VIGRKEERKQYKEKENECVIEKSRENPLK
jgi:hypothetical protein